MSNTVYCLGIIWICAALGKAELSNIGLVIFGIVADMWAFHKKYRCAPDWGGSQ